MTWRRGDLFQYSLRTVICVFVKASNSIIFVIIITIIIIIIVVINVYWFSLRQGITRSIGRPIRALFIISLSQVFGGVFIFPRRRITRRVAGRRFYSMRRTSVKTAWKLMCEFLNNIRRRTFEVNCIT